MANGTWLRDRSYHAAPDEPRHRLRLLQGPVQSHVAEDRAGEAILGWRSIALRQRERGSDLSIPARITDGGIAARSPYAVLRFAVRPSDARRRRDVGADLPGSHGERSKAA